MGENGTVVGVIVGLSAVLYLKFGTNVAWTWYVIAGSLSTFLAGVLVSPLVDRSPKGNA
ncbi:MAG: hypothetical protein LC114_05190 [Bryobacterales bacterium]|nr:hypothetical protein [Bryobacterales bacterium]